MIPSVLGENTERNRKTQQINTLPRDWCCRWNFGVSIHRVAYTVPGLLMLDGVYLNQREKRIMAQELARLIEKSLN